MTQDKLPELETYQSYLIEMTGLPYVVDLELFGQEELATVRLAGRLLSGQRRRVFCEQLGHRRLNQRLPARLGYGGIYAQVIRTTRAWQIRQQHQALLARIMPLLLKEGVSFSAEPWYDYDENHPGFPAGWQWDTLSHLKGEPRSGGHDSQLADLACYEFWWNTTRCPWNAYSIEQLVRKARLLKILP